MIAAAQQLERTQSGGGLRRRAWTETPESSAHSSCSSSSSHYFRTKDFTEKRQQLVPLLTPIKDSPRRVSQFDDKETPKSLELPVLENPKKSVVEYAKREHLSLSITTKWHR